MRILLQGKFFIAVNLSNPDAPWVIQKDDPETGEVFHAKTFECLAPTKGFTRMESEHRIGRIRVEIPFASASIENGHATFLPLIV